MRELDLFRVFTDRLEGTGISYMVTGSVASMVYGEPRLTHDVDIVIELEVGASERLCALFREEGFYCPPEDTIRIEAARPARGHFNAAPREQQVKDYLKGDEWLAMENLHPEHAVYRCRLPGLRLYRHQGQATAARARGEQCRRSSP